MDSVLSRIIELDKQALNIKEKIKEMEKSNSQKLKKILGDLEIQIIEEGKRLGIEQYQIFVNEGIAQKEKVLKEAQKECELLERSFINKFEDLKNSAFNDIFRV